MVTAAPPHKHARHPKPVRIALAHIKLVAATVLWIVLFAFLPIAWWVTRGLLAWNIAVGLYLVMVAILISRSEHHHVQQRAKDEDEGGALVLILTVAAAAASLVAIFVQSAGQKANLLSALLVLSTVVLSWFFIHVIFAFHYAHEYYGHQRVDARLRRATAKDGHKGGLKFPADDQPEYWDFVYFSFAIGTTSQVTDVLVTGKAMRRLVVGHGVVSFFYNVAVLALMVSLGGEFIKG